MAAKRGQNEDSIYYDNTRECWVAAVSLGRDGQGRRRRITRAAQTRTEARHKLKELRTSLDAGLPPPSARLTVGQYLQRWLTVNVPATVSRRTQDQYEDTVRLHLEPAIGNTTLTNLTVADLNDLWASKRADGYSANSIRIMRTVLRRALGRAEREGLILRNVAALSEPPKIPKSEGRSLTVVQARQLLDAAKGDRLEACYAITLAYGLRRGEVLGLAWPDVDLDRGTATLRRGLGRVKESPLPDGTYPNGRKTRLVFTDLKTARSRRQIELTKPIVELLRRHAERQADERRRAADLWRDHDLVFCTPLGTPVDPDNFNGMFDRLCERAGLGHWHPHELRHSGASLMLALGTPLHVVSEVLGHSSIAITKDVYGHLIAGERRGAAETITAALWSADDADLSAADDDGPRTTARRKARGKPSGRSTERDGDDDPSGGPAPR